MGRTVQLTEPTTFEREDCPSCGVIHFVPQDLQMRAKRDGRSFYCPNGHSASYGENDLAKAQKLAKDWEAYSKAETARKDRALAEANEQRAAAATAREEARKAVASRKRLKTRVQNGICPCCTRSFTNLRRHMATKHPTVKQPDKSGDHHV